MTGLKDIDPIIKKYELALKTLVTASVPQALVSYDLDIVNGLSVQLYNAQAMRLVDVDPIRGLAAISQETPARTAINDGALQIKTYLQERGIPFTY